MSLTSDTVQDYCTSEHFFFLDPTLKEYAESLLAFWCDKAGDEITEVTIEAAAQQVARLDVPLPVRKAFPDLLTAFFEYLAGSGRFPGAQGWLRVVTRMDKTYRDSFRNVGSVRGETSRRGRRMSGETIPVPAAVGKSTKNVVTVYPDDCRFPAAYCGESRK